MVIIPAINCQDFKCVKEKLQKAAEFSNWVQIDIADGKFTPYKTWNNLSEISNLKSQISNINLELHLMVENPEDVIDDWIKSGAKRIIIHHESIVSLADKNPDNNDTDILNLLLLKCRAKEIELGLAINLDSPVETILRHLDKIRFIQILAVEPGKAGQELKKEALEKIKILKAESYGFSDILIEIDGGINLETAKLAKESGADIAVSASYLWNSPDPAKTFNKLKNI